MRMNHVFLAALVVLIGCATQVESSSENDQVQYLTSESDEWTPAPVTMSFQARIDRTNFGQGADWKNQTWFAWDHGGKEYRVLKRNVVKAELKEAMQDAVDEDKHVILRIENGRLVWARGLRDMIR